MVDHSLFEAQPDELVPNPRSLLIDLLGHDLVDTLRYSGEADPEASAGGPDIPTVLVLHGQTRGDIVQTTLYRSDKSLFHTGVFTSLADAAEKDAGADSYPGLEATERARSRWRDVLAAETARSVRADIYVTERPYVFESRYLKNAPTYTPAQALALVGLYLRGQGEYVIHRGIGGWPRSFDRGLFYWVGAREFLGDGWRWFSACVQTAAHTDTDDMTYLGQSLLHRISRALELRDRFHRSINRVQNNNTADDAVAELDVVLLLLMGAVDVAARVAHHALDLPMSRAHRASWQSREWIRLVGRLAPDLADIVVGDADGRRTLTMLRLRVRLF